MQPKGNKQNDTATDDNNRENAKTQSPERKIATTENDTIWTKIRLMIVYFSLYFAGLFTLMVIIADPFAMSTYFSENSLMPGLAHREFSLVTEAEYYLSALEKQSSLFESNDSLSISLANTPRIISFIKNELDNFGLEVYEQNFSYTDGDGKQYNGTNLYSIIRGQRSTSSESIALCAPFIKNKDKNTLSGVSLSLALTKYFSTRSYWAKDVIVLFVDREEYGVSAWIDSYYDVKFRSDIKRMGSNRDGIYYDSLPERSGPIQAAIILELTGRYFARVNLKIQGMYGQLPNLDLFNLAVELASRESVTPYFYDKSLPYGLSSEMDLYRHNLETAISFIRTQATMRADGLHGYFLRYAIQSLTLEAPEHDSSDRSVLLASLLNVGRMVEGIFRSLNNLTERFNRSYYFYILVSLRRFTSIGYYMIAFGLMVAPLLLRAYRIHQRRTLLGKLFIGYRGLVLLASALAISLLSTFNISSALIASTAFVPILIVI